MTLPRRTPLRGGLPLQRKARLTSGTSANPEARQSPRRRSPSRTGPTAAVNRLVLTRDGGTCVINVTCIGQARDIHIHHRENRGMGGSTAPHINRPPNLLAACDQCNGWLEDATATERAIAVDAGWKLRHGQDASTVPVLYPDGSWWILGDDGGRRPV